MSPGQGRGRAGFDSDEDRGDDPSGHRGGRKDLTDRKPDPDANPLANGQHHHPASQTQHLGLNIPSPTEK